MNTAEAPTGRGSRELCRRAELGRRAREPDGDPGGRDRPRISGATARTAHPPAQLAASLGKKA